MKKILILLFLICSPCYALYTIDINKRDNFINSLNLSKKQSQKIEKIEQEYNPQITKLNAQIILLDMQIAQLRVNPKNKQHINSLKIKNSSLQEELGDILEEKNKEILSCLGFFQKRKYKRYISGKN